MEDIDNELAALELDLDSSGNFSTPSRSGSREKLLLSRIASLGEELNQVRHNLICTVKEGEVLREQVRRGRDRSAVGVSIGGDLSRKQVRHTWNTGLCAMPWLCSLHASPWCRLALRHLWVLIMLL